jgi:hypothetical protein
MTISSTTRLAGPYTGTGTTGPFTFAFKVFQASDLYVVRREISTKVETVFALTTNYTVALNGNQDSNPGGSITLVAALTSAYTLTVSSDIQNLQSTDLTNQGGFYPEVITDALDRACIQIQQLASETARSMIAPLSDGVSNNLALPSAATRANKHLAFDASGVPIAVEAGGFDLTAKAGEVLAGPQSGGDAQATFRSLQATDVPPLDSLTAPAGNLSLNNKKITSLATPTVSTDAATKGYIDGIPLNSIAAPTGSVSLNSQKITSLATPTVSTDAATKGYVDGIPYSDTANKVLATPNGSTGSATFRAIVGADLPTLNLIPAPVAAVSLNSQKITSLATPTVSTDAATKGYVDGLPLYNLDPQTGINATNLASEQFKIEIDVNSIDSKRIAIIDTTLDIATSSTGTNFIRLKNTNSTTAIKVMVLWAELQWFAHPSGSSSVVSPDSVPNMPWAYTRGVFTQGIATLAASSANGYFQGTGSGWPVGYSNESNSVTPFSGGGRATIKLWIIRLT